MVVYPWEINRNFGISKDVETYAPRNYLQGRIPNSLLGQMDLVKSDSRIAENSRNNNCYQ
jgi:hypothetical protein